ncbi:MAG: hypothetical protein GDA50_04075 [Alphaproteobacteria bacterium GM202ARS2]|nr:hypothetical protein [Alphaproteobacteria bacterium GM202ARS2]
MGQNLPGRPFTDVLGEIENGAMLHDLTEAVYSMVAQVTDVRKPGKMTLVLDFVPTGRETVNIDATLKVKEPEHDRPSTTFFVGKDFGLHRDDPSQDRLPLRTVVDDDREPITVAE